MSDVAVLGGCSDAYPVQKKSIPASVMREYAHLRFRTSQTSAVMRVRDGLARDWHDWFEDHEFIHIHTPVLTSSDCEGAGEVFSIAEGEEPFFPKPVSLTVSSQLHLEAPTHALSRTYTLSPAFRAEPSQTSRHLCEFYMLEAEVAFTSSLDELCDVVESSIRDTLDRLLTSQSPRAVRMRDDIGRIAASIAAANDTAPPQDPLSHLRLGAFKRITYADAISLLTEEHASRPFLIPPGDGLASEHEKWLAAQFGPTFVTHYPASQKPFYMLPSGEDTVAAFDLLFPDVGEMAGGSLREHREAPLLASISKHGLKPDEYEWYTDLRRFGSAPHGGWGMGWERWVCYVTQVRNVRDVVAFPRWAGSCRF